MTKSVLAGVLFLSAFTEGLHIPGLLSKDYNYGDKLTIQQGYYLETPGRTGIMQDLKSVALKKTKGVVSMAPRFPLKSAFNICAPNESHDEHMNLIKESPISGYLSASSKVYDTLY